ncbi:FAS1 domain-containing protein [Plectosphaerella plurivora]|uniref:FAS1 domain-containing protein n=1 Tax=Plectosphaerella plurivora TaxID=936078 RepID=A0A9P8VK35_9PEZI|nr:FAS1 domain-containing protein [Plectosphaerella plurivora]
MYSETLVALLLATGAFAQDSNQRTLTEALASNNASLSSLSRLIGTLPAGVVEQLNQANNITILAPNNDALADFISNSTEAIASDPGLVTAVLNYHILNGTFYESNLTASSSALFVPTLLSNETYTRVTGGQRVEVISGDDGVTVYSALKEASKVVETNLNFTGGTIHVIDRVLSVPQGVASTLRDANLTAALGAVQRANLGDTLSQASDITVFAPNNEAFARIASLGGDLNETTLQSILSYHVIEGEVLYSDMIENTTVRSLDNNTDLTISVIDGNVFVNNAEVVIQDVLISNGVVHVINNVLNPGNATVTPDPAASTPAPAFTDGTTASGGENPFTSGVEGPTTTAPVATGANPGGGSAGGSGNNGGGSGEGATSTSEQAAMPMRTGAVGVAALFGAGVVAFNM